MFRLLSKESNIFSVPVYISFLFLLVITINILHFNTLALVSAILMFAGTALGYFCFNALGLNYRTHLPLCLYTFFVFALYPGGIDLGLSAALLTNSFLLLLLASSDEESRKTSNVLAGAILAINFFLIPISWPMIVFAILHVIGTSRNISLNIFRIIFGGLCIAVSYFSAAYFFNLDSWNSDYFPFLPLYFNHDIYPLHLLIPVMLMLIYAVADHFVHYNEKSPVSRYKYTFLLVFSLAQLITILLYTGKNYEYLLLLALPASIILARMLRFLPKPWMRESGLWLIIFCLLGFKIANLLP